MRTLNKGKSVLYGLVVGIIILALSGCNLPSRSRVEVEILSPADGQSVVLGQEVRIISIASSTKGIEGIEIFINGELLSTDNPLLATQGIVIGSALDPD